MSIHTKKFFGASGGGSIGFVDVEGKSQLATALREASFSPVNSTTHQRAFPRCASATGGAVVGEIRRLAVA